MRAAEKENAEYERKRAAVDEVRKRGVCGWDGFPPRVMFDRPHPTHHGHETLTDPHIP